MYEELREYIPTNGCSESYDKFGRSSIDSSRSALQNGFVDPSGKNPTSDATWRSLFAFTTPRHGLILATAIVLSILSGLVTPAMAVVLGRIFGGFAITKVGSGNLEVPQFLDDVGAEVLNLVILGLLSWVLNGSFFASWLWFGELQAKTAKAIMFEGLIDKELEWYENQKDGLSSLLAKCQTQIKELQIAVSQPLGYASQSAVAAFVSFSIAFYYSWSLTIIILAGAPIGFGVLTILSNSIQVHIDCQREFLSQAAQVASRAIKYIETVKAFNGQKHEMVTFSQAVEKAADAYNSQAKINALQTGSIRFLTLVMFVQGFWYGSYLIKHNETTAEAVMTTFWSCLMGTQALELILPQMMSLEKGRAAGSELNALLLKIECGRNNSRMRRGIMPQECHGKIEISKVSFAYPARASELVLKNISFIIPAYETTFIMGQNGSGKSTLGNLILNAYKPSSGTILIDGNSSSELDARWIRRHVSLVQQNSVVFNDSIFRNVAFGRIDYECVTRKLVSNACKMADLQGTILDFPLGLETEVGVGGRCLSGGQLQRVALARDKLRDATILILDEGLSELDIKTRVHVLKAIREWRKGKTTIIITHDFNEIEAEDFVLILDHGKLVQEGYRKDIENRNGSFQYLAISEKEVQDIIPLNDADAQEPDSPPTSDGRIEPTPRFSTSKISTEDTRVLLESKVLRDSRNSRDTRAKNSKKSTRLRSRDEMEVSLFQILSTVWQSLNRRGRVLLVTGFVFALAHAAATPIFSYALARLLSTILDSRTHYSDTKRWSMAIIAIAVGDALSCYFMHSILEYCGQAWVDNIRVGSMRRVLQQPRSWFDKDNNTEPQIIEGLEKNIEEMRNLLARFSGYTTVGIFMTLIGVTWSFAVCWRLTVVGLIVAPVMYGISCGLSLTSDKWESQCNEAAASTGSTFHEAITNIRTVRSFSLERYFRAKYFGSLHTEQRLGAKRSLAEGIGFGLSDSAIMFACALIFYYGSMLVENGQEDLQDILSSFTLLIFSLASANAMIGMIPQLSNSKHAARQVLRLANLPKRSHEYLGRREISQSSSISFHDVSFAYPSRSDAMVLSGLSFAIPEGSCTAIVGASGSGKSTLASLLLRLYPVSSGTITFGDDLLTSISIRSLRSEIAIVHQRPVLFDCSIAENITYGLSPKAVTPARIEAAARAVGLHDFILGLPNGYDTTLGDQGSGLSAGQTQRIAIARALVRKPRVLILDECTSNLDVRSAATVRETIIKLVGAEGGSGCTVLIITHNVKLIRTVQNIIVLKHGREFETGHWDQLRGKGGELDRLVNGGGLEV